MTQVIQASTFRANMKTVLDQVESTPDKMFVVQRKGNTSSVLVNSDFLEELLDSHDSKYLESIKEARAQINKGKTFSFNQVFGEIA